MTWRLARSLEALRDEINALAPDRSKVSDGTVGDTSHSARASDHNPNSAGVVRAMDVTDDKAHLDAGYLADQIVDLGKAGHPALGPGAYVIWTGRIASATYGWVWRTYSGSNPHNHHVHVSVATSAAGYDSTAPWLKETDEMTPDDLTKIKEAVETAMKPVREAIAAERQRDRASWKREKALIKALREQGVDVDKILAAVDEP